MNFTPSQKVSIPMGICPALHFGFMVGLLLSMLPHGVLASDPPSKEVGISPVWSERPARVVTFDSNGGNHSVGSWEGVKRNQNGNTPSAVVPPTPVQQLGKRADEAMASGDYDEATRLLEKAREVSPNDATLIPKLNAARFQKISTEVKAANSRRGVELSRVLEQAAKTLPLQLQSPSPTVALADVGGNPNTDPRVVDLRGVQSFVVDPAFFKPGRVGETLQTAPGRRFTEPPAPGETLSPVAFAGSPYATIFESAEIEKLILGGLRSDPAKVPGDLHKSWEAWNRKIDALPPQPVYVVTSARDAAFEPSRLQVKAAYEDYRKRRKELLGVAANASIRAMRSMIEGMENEAWFKPGDNLELKTKNDPLLKATLDERARVVRWYAELYLDEAENRAYQEMADRVTRILKENQ